MRNLLLSLSLIVACSALPASAANEGRITGGNNYTLPGWFKKSFLDLKEDLNQAKARNRHLIVFMHLDDCPYCARFLNENFREGGNRAFMENHFDVVPLNIRGANPVEWFDGKTYPEKVLADHLKVVATPTVVFVDADGKIVLRLNGYRQPAAFRQTLEFVHGRHYQTQTLASFVAQQKQKPVYEFRPHPSFVQTGDLGGYRQPLAVIFEDRDCADCPEVHERVFSHPEVLPELKKYRVVRLDAYSGAPIVDIDGRQTTPREWATKLNVVYRPGVVLFNEGKERARVDGMQHHFHFKTWLSYVSGQNYKRYPRFRNYNQVRQEELLKQGVTIDLSR